MIKTAGAPDGMLSKLKSISDSLDPKLFPSLWPLKAGFHETARDLEELAAAVALLGMVAFSMAGIGVVGLVAYAVSQQKKEIAIRIALGTEQVQLLLSILRQFSWPLIAGLVTGAGITAGFSKALRKTLYGISNLDAASYAVAIGLLVLVTGIAVLMPAKRVLRLNVSKTLRYD